MILCVLSSVLLPEGVQDLAQPAPSQNKHSTVHKLAATTKHTVTRSLYTSLGLYISSGFHLEMFTRGQNWRSKHLREGKTNFGGTTTTTTFLSIGINFKFRGGMPLPPPHPPMKP